MPIVTSTSSQKAARPAGSRLDVVGGIASLVCAAHCVALPALALVLPAAGLVALESHAFDQAFAVAACVFGALVIGHGLCREWAGRVVSMFLLGVMLLMAGAFVFEGLAHALLLAAGGILVGAAHLTNRRGIRVHRCRPVNLYAGFGRRWLQPAEAAEPVPPAS